MVLGEVFVEIFFVVVGLVGCGVCGEEVVVCWVVFDLVGDKFVFCDFLFVIFIGIFVDVVVGDE